MISDIFKETNNGVEFYVYLSPGAKREEIIGRFEFDDKLMLKISIRAKPINNNANTALISFLSDKLMIAKSNITITKGLKSKVKKISVTNLKLSNIPKEIHNICS